MQSHRVTPNASEAPIITKLTEVGYTKYNRPKQVLHCGFVHSWIPFSIRNISPLLAQKVRLERWKQNLFSLLEDETLPELVLDGHV